jgi:hypothetical protein
MTHRPDIVKCSRNFDPDIDAKLRSRVIVHTRGFSVLLVQHGVLYDISDSIRPRFCASMKQVYQVVGLGRFFWLYKKRRGKNGHIRTLDGSIVLLDIFLGEALNVRYERYE